MNEASEESRPVAEWIEAARRGDVDFVVDRLGRGMDVDARGRLNVTALMAAAGRGHVELIRILLDHGADPNLEDGKGHTAVTHAAIGSRARERRGESLPPAEAEPLSLLLAAGGRCSFRDAVWLGDVELARARLDEGADVDAGRGSYDGPMLMIAAGFGPLEMVDLLLSRGADVEAMDDLGQRPLTRAAHCGRVEVVLRLLEYGANIDAVDWFGRSSLAYAALEGRRAVYDVLLSQGARRGPIDTLVVEDMSLFDQYDGHSLLAEAARCGRVDVVKTLIDRGADFHAVGRDGLTPLEWAVREGRDEVADVLRRAGAVR
ncbi:ankyrin repeat domain-containing protein [Paludisphaera mucosa]|uniref:Ankyrin repeat domain-containing protein n=1 Tax=Paludisphaera mucosa TaxID=3030827 RepID=A0ABT6FBA9_9BACT|nr:ankyrin repeat domain-containing protein [Paludisphaera mucosa]MDG3004835.1 ankyrin repeat domain-containing protein [Paludisphaera mucosa]